MSGYRDGMVAPALVICASLLLLAAPRLLRPAINHALGYVGRAIDNVDWRFDK